MKSEFLNFHHSNWSVSNLLNSIDEEVVSKIIERAFRNYLDVSTGFWPFFQIDSKIDIADSHRNNKILSFQDQIRVLLSFDACGSSWHLGGFERVRPGYLFDTGMRKLDQPLGILETIFLESPWTNQDYDFMECHWCVSITADWHSVALVVGLHLWEASTELDTHIAQQQPRHRHPRHTFVFQ